ncbi:MAG TPA: YetF domain-containing protein [Blastocatellia bacterium]
MEAVLRAVVIYAFLMLLFRIAGKRALNEMSNFEFVLLLIVGEATQQAVLGKDYSVTNAFLVVLTLISINIGMSLLKHRSERLKRMFDGMPLVIVENGRPLKQVMDAVRVAEDDVLEAARELQGLERMEQIKYAVLETTGTISIIPKKD